MPQNRIETLTMYNIENGEFYKPDNSISYSPSNNFVINNWNTWIRAFIYWMRDYFNFTISSGPGTSMGQIGWKNIDWQAPYKNDFINTQGIGYDNDWTSANYGLYKIDKEGWIRENSPFKPVIEDGVPYYCTINSNNEDLIWNATWGEGCNDNLGFDDNNNRFDIILTSNEYNNLGLRIKYPITTTGFKRQKALTAYTNSNDSPFVNLTFLMPGITPTLNGIKIANLDNASQYTDMNMITLNSIGFVTFLNRRLSSFYTVQSHGGPNNSYNTSNLTSSINFQGWTPSFMSKVNTDLTFSNFIRYNKIKFLKSYNNKILLIAIVDGEDNILTQFCFYKNLDNSANLIIAEDRKSNKNKSICWIKDNEYNYGHTSFIVGNSPNFYDVNYGNLANIIVNSKNNFIVTPSKYFKDVRGSKTYITEIIVNSASDNNSYTTPRTVQYKIAFNNSLNLDLISPEGLWELKNFEDTLGNTASDLYLVTLAGSSDLINNQGKIIKTKINNKDTKLLVVPFNGAKINEYDIEDNSYLIAIPIEQEE